MIEERGTVDSAQWLASYQERLDRMAADTQAAQTNLRQASGRAASARGEVEVSVASSGALTGLRLAASVRAMESDQLAQLILDTAREAHRAVGSQVVGIMTEYVGEGPALDRIRERVPEAMAQSDTRTDDEYFTAPEIIQ